MNDPTRGTTPFGAAQELRIAGDPAMGGAAQRARLAALSEQEKIGRASCRERV